MSYQCQKGHQSSDPDYCSECGALIEQSNISMYEQMKVPTNSQEICPDCGTPRAVNARFCEVCRYDFQENRTGSAENILISQKEKNTTKQEDAVAREDIVLLDKLNVVISVDMVKASYSAGETVIKPDSVDRIFPLDLDENLIGRRYAKKGIYPEIDINDPGVSHRHLKFIREADGSFSALELGSSNGTELNGVSLEPGIQTSVKAGDELIIGLWTRIKLVAR